MNYKYKVLGINRLDFVTDDGNRINGAQLWVCAPTSAGNWVGGLEVFKLWIDAGNPLMPEVMALRHGDTISGECDRKGRPISIYTE